MALQKEQIKNNLKKIRQFNISNEMGDEFESFVLNSDLTETQANQLCLLVEKITTQHYVRQLLIRELK